jgi:hypothetical protein
MAYMHDMVHNPKYAIYCSYMTPIGICIVLLCLSLMFKYIDDHRNNGGASA